MESETPYHFAHITYELLKTGLEPLLGGRRTIPQSERATAEFRAGKEPALCRVPLGEFRATLAGIVRLCRRHGAVVVGLISPIPRDTLAKSAWPEVGAADVELLERLELLAALAFAGQHLGLRHVELEPFAAYHLEQDRLVRSWRCRRGHWCICIRL